MDIFVPPPSTTPTPAAAAAVAAVATPLLLQPPSGPQELLQLALAATGQPAATAGQLAQTIRGLRSMVRLCQRHQVTGQTDGKSQGVMFDWAALRECGESGQEDGRAGAAAVDGWLEKWWEEQEQEQQQDGVREMGRQGQHGEKLFVVKVPQSAASGVGKQQQQQQGMASAGGETVWMILTQPQGQMARRGERRYEAAFAATSCTISLPDLPYM